MTREKRPGTPRAFTLVELLIVIAIIAALIGLTVAVGSRVISGGKKDLTRSTIEILNSAMQEYQSDKGQILPSVVKSPDSADDLLLAADVVVVSGTPGELLWPSGAVAVLAMRESSSARAVLEQLNPRVISDVTINLSGDLVTLTSVIDGWGNPIRFVHPAFDGHWEDYLADRAVNGNIEDALGSLRGSQSYFPDPANTLRRETEEGDADGGLAGNAPYFYSAGPDGDPGTTADNVYSRDITFQPHQN